MLVLLLTWSFLEIVGCDVVVRVRVLFRQYISYNLQDGHCYILLWLSTCLSEITVWDKEKAVWAITFDVVIRLTIQALRNFSLLLRYSSTSILFYNNDFIPKIDIVIVPIWFEINREQWLWAYGLVMYYIILYIYHNENFLIYFYWNFGNKSWNCFFRIFKSNELWTTFKNKNCFKLFFCYPV